MKNQKVILLVLRISIFALPLIVFCWIIYKDFVVSGKLVSQYDFKTLSPFITVLRPQGRVSEIKEDGGGVFYQELKDEPVYFDVRLPRSFSKAKIRLRYKSFHQGVIELGAMTELERWNFVLKPVENQIINFLLQDKLHWDIVREGDVILFQKQKKFSSIREFLENLPPAEFIASYNFSVEKEFVLEGAEVKKGGIDIFKTLRGSHRMHVYVKDEPLDFIFLLQDVNRHAGDDYASIDVYRGKENLYHDFIKLDENSKDNRIMSETKEMRVRLPYTGDGAYRIEVTSPTDDIFIRRISTPQDYLVFINSVYFGDNVGYSDEFDKERESKTKLFTNARIIAAKTTHQEGLQTILFGKKQFRVKETHRKYFYKTFFGTHEITIPKNDIVLDGKGLFSFSKESFFNPDVTTLSDGSEFDTEKIHYVITRYRPPRELENGWRENEIDFVVPSYYIKDREMHFIISIPYLEEDGGTIYIGGIRAELIDDPLSWKKIFELIQQYIFYER